MAAFRVSFRPTLTMERWRSAYRLWLTFRPYVWRHKRALLGALVFGLGGIAVRIAQPWPLKYLFDSVLIPMGGGAADEFPMRPVLLICGSILLLGISSSLFMYGELVLSASAGQRIATSLRRRLFGHLLTLPLGYHRWARRGETVNLLGRDIQNLKELLVNVIMTVSASIIHVVALLSIMFALNARLALVATAVLPIVFLSAVRVTRVMRKVNRDQRERETQLMSSGQEVLRSIPVVKIFGREAFERRRFAGLNRRSLRAGLKLKRLEASLNRRVEFWLALGACLFILIGVREVVGGRLTAGELLVFAAYLKGTQKPLRRLSRTSTRIAKAVVCGERIQVVLDIAGEPVTEAEEALPIGGSSVAVRFENVSFAYENGRAVIADASFDVPAGATVAVVGPSGAGKTTLLALLARLYEPTGGRIRFDGVDVSTLPIERVRRSVSAVFQEPYLFRGSIGDNLRYGREGAGNDDLARVVSRAHADFVHQFPHRFEALVGDEAQTLSGGERQRLAIARALLRDAPIVLLDEPTVGLDEDSERHVLEGLHELVAGRTCFWSSHDLDQVAGADFTLYVGRDGIDLHPGAPSPDELDARRDPLVQGAAHHA